MTAGNQSLYDKAVRLLELNRVTTGPHRYTRPSPRVYEQQWLWDSCFHAITYTHVDLELAKDEIRSALHWQVTSGPNEGMVPHMSYWTGGGDELWGHSNRSGITQPPVIASAVLRIHDREPDRRFLDEVYPKLSRYYGWLFERRDLDRDGLVSIIHPWESGWDNSVRWDSLMAYGDDDPANVNSRKRLCASLKSVGFDAEKAAEKGLFNVEAVDFNLILAESLRAMSILAEAKGLRGDQTGWTRLREKCAGAIEEKCWDPDMGMFCDLAGDDEIRLKVRTPAGMFALFAGVASEEQASQIVRQLTDESLFWTRYPVPTVSIDSRAFSRYRYWRGTTWVNINWFIVNGLLRYGYNDVARELGNRTIELVMKNGFWEYYDPVSGAGLGAENLSWSSLVLDIHWLIENSHYENSQ